MIYDTFSKNGLISQAVNGITLNPLRVDVFIAVCSGLAGRRKEPLSDL